MTNDPIRVVIDTNIWVSMALGSRVVSEQMAYLLQDPNLDVFVSAELLEELTDTLAKPRLQKYLSHNRTKNLFDLIWEKAKLTVVDSTETFCRDKKDDFIINLAIDANASFIITGDQDLLVLHPIRHISICTLSSFLSISPSLPSIG